MSDHYTSLQQKTCKHFFYKWTNLFKVVCSKLHTMLQVLYTTKTIQKRNCSNMNYSKLYKTLHNFTQLLRTIVFKQKNKHFTTLHITLNNYTILLQTIRNHTQLYATIPNCTQFNITWQTNTNLLQDTSKTWHNFYKTLQKPYTTLHNCTQLMQKLYKA